MLSAKLDHQPQLLPLPQPEHDAAGPKSMPELILNPYPKKSTVTGLAFSSKSLSMINWKPLTSYTLSVSLGSSRAIANEGPPQPPSFKKIRMGTTSRSLKYSAICWLAASETSTITSSLILKYDQVIQSYDSCLTAIMILMLITGTCFVNDKCSVQIVTGSTPDS